MKKFTIFLLTFLLFVGFINVNAQSSADNIGGSTLLGSSADNIGGSTQRSADKIGGSTLSGLYCGEPGAAVTIEFNVLDTVNTPGQIEPSIRDQKIFWSTTELTDYYDAGWTLFTPGAGSITPNGLTFWLTIDPFNLTHYYYAEAVVTRIDGGIDTLKSAIMPIYVIPSAKIQFDPDPLIGIMCEGGDLDLDATVVWPHPDAQNAHISYRWFHNGTSLGPPPPPPFNPITIGETVSHNFEDLNAGAHSFGFYLTVFDQYGNPAIGCDVDSTLNITVYEQPTVWAAMDNDNMVCDSAATFDITVGGEFAEQECDYQLVIEIYLDDALLASTTEIIPSGEEIDEDGYILSVATSALELCANDLEVRLTINNLEYCNDELVTLTAGCSATDEISVVLYQFIQADAGEDTGICGDGTITMDANDPSGDEELCNDGYGFWSIVDEGNYDFTIEIDNEYDPNTTVDFAGIEGIHVVEFVWTVWNGACISTDTVKVVVTEKPVINMSSNLSSQTSGYNGICDNEEDYTITIAVWTPEDGYNCDVSVTYNLYEDGELFDTFIDTIPAGTPIPDFSSIIPIDEDHQCGEYDYVGEVVIKNLEEVCDVPVDYILSCITRTDEGEEILPFVVTVYKFIEANAGEDDVVCGDGEYQLNANDPYDEEDECTETAIGRWYVEDAYIYEGDGITFAFDPNENTPDATVTITGVPGTQAFNFIWSITNGTCIDEDTITIVVHEIPQMNFEPQDTKVCWDETYEFEAVVFYDNTDEDDCAPFDYTWGTDLITDEDPDLAEIIVTNDSSIFTITKLTASGKLWVTITDNFGCEVTDTLYVHPVPTLTDIEIDVLPCCGELATLSFEVLTPEDNYSIEWKFAGYYTGGGAFADNLEGEESNTLEVYGVCQDLDSIVYTVRVTNDETLCYKEKSFTLKPVDNPVINVTIDEIPSPLCNNSYINLHGYDFIREGYEDTNQTYEWYMATYPNCEDATWDFEDFEPIDETELQTRFKIEVDDTQVGAIIFALVVKTDGYNCPYITYSNCVTITKSIKTEIVGNDHDTICHGGSVNIMYNLSNFDQNDGPVYYMWLENGLYLEGIENRYLLGPGETWADFTTDPALHTSQEGPESYCYQLLIWQGDYPPATDPLNPAYCHTLSECHWVTVLKDPVVSIVGPTKIAKNTESVDFTASVVGGYDIISYQWYLDGELVEGATDKVFTMTREDFPDILENLGDNHLVEVYVFQDHSGCDGYAELRFDVVCIDGRVTIEGTHAACVGDRVWLTAIVEPSGADYTLTWKQDGNYINEGTEHDLIYSFIVEEPINMTHFQVEVSFCGCEAVYSGDHEFQALPITVVEVDNYIICENGAITVDVDVHNWTDGLLYHLEWYYTEEDEDPFDITYKTWRIFTYAEMLETMVEGVATFYVKAVMLNNICSSELVAFTITTQGALEPVDIIPGTLITCVNTPVLFTLGEDANVEMFGDPTYSWWVDGIEIPGESLDYLNFHFHTVGTHYVYAKLIYPNNTCEFVTDQVAIEVRNIGSVTIEGPSLVCNAAEPTELFAIVNPFEGNYTYQWSEDGVAKGTDSVQLVSNVPSPYPYIYLVTVTDPESGCYAQATWEVKVEEFVTIGITATTTAVCVGGEVILTANVPEDNNMNYQWYAGGVEIDGANTPIYYIYPDTTAIYTFTSTQTGSECVATSNEITVTVVATPIIEVTPVIDTICQGDEITFTARLLTQDPVNFTWYIDGIVVPGAELATLTYRFDHDGVFPVKVFATTQVAGCESVIVTAGTITVKYAPSVTIEGPTFVCNTEIPTYLHAIIDPSNATVEYQWSVIHNNVVTPLGTAAMQVVSNVASPNPYIYVVEITDSESDCIIKETHSVTVGQYPTVAITATTTDVCTGGEVVITANVPLNVTNIEYQWYTVIEVAGETELVPIAGETNPVLYVYPTATTVYAFTATEIETVCVANSNMITVVVVPQPVITTVLVRDTICTGEQVNFAALLTTNDAVTYTWYVNDILVQGADLATLTYTFDHFGLFEVKVFATTDVAGCVSEMITAGIIYVKDAPTVVIEGPSFACPDLDPTVLYAHVTPLNPTVDYQWAVSHNNISTALGIAPTQIVSNIASPYPYIYTVVITDYESGCVTISDPHTFYVLEDPVVSIEVDNLQICAEETIKLTALLDEEPNMTYQWYADGVAIEFANTLTWYVYGQTETTVYTFSATRNGTTCVAHSNPITVEVIPAPTVIITPIIDNICKGEQITFVATVTPDIPVIYTWFMNDVILPDATENSLTITFNQAGEYDIYVLATSLAAECSSAKAYAGTILVKDAPTVKIEGPHDVCNAEDPTVLYAHVMPPNAPVTYQWYVEYNGIQEILGTEPSQQVSNEPSAWPYVYHVEIYDEVSGCLVKSDQHSVIVFSFGNVPITSDIETACYGTTANLSANIDEIGNMLYQWYHNGDPIEGADAPNYSLIPGVGENEYWFTITQVGSYCSASSNTVTIVIHPYPDAPVLTVSDETICSGDHVTISGDVEDYDYYTWYPSYGDFFVNLSTIIDQPTANNILTPYTYTATVTVNGCTSDPSVPVTVMVHPEISVLIVGAEYVCDQALATEHLSLHAIIDVQNGVHYKYEWFYYHGNNPAVNFYTDYDVDGEYAIIPNNLPISDYADPYWFTVEVTAIDYDCTVSSLPHEVNIWAQPTVDIDVDYTAICQNGTVNATAYPNPPIAPNDFSYYYIWTVNGVELYSHSEHAVFENNWNVGNNVISVKVQLYHLGSLVGSCHGTNDRLIYVAASPSLALTQDIGGLQLPGMCVDGDLGHQIHLLAEIDEFDAILINPDEFTYVWRLFGPNGTQFEAPPYNELTYTPPTTGTYTFEVKAVIDNNLGCSTPWTTFDPVKVVPQPTVTIYPKDYNSFDVCVGAIIEIDNELGIADATIQLGYRYKWNDINQWTNFTNQIDPRFIEFNTPGNYTYFLTAEFANPTCDAATSDKFTYKVVNDPIWKVININPDLYDGLCFGEIVTLNAEFDGGVTDGSNNAHIQWMYKMDDEDYVNITGVGGNKTHKPAQIGEFYYMATYIPAHELSGCNIDPVELGPLTIHPASTARFINEELPPYLPPHICANLGITPVELIVEFTGNPPFYYHVVGTSGNFDKYFTSYTNIHSFEVTPRITTTYTIERLEAQCVAVDFVQSSITVEVTDVEILNPHLEACGSTAELYLNMRSFKSPEIVVTFPCGAPIHVNVMQTGSNYTLAIPIPDCLPIGIHEVTISIDGCDYDITIMNNYDATTGEVHQLVYRRWEGNGEALVVSNNYMNIESQYYNGGFEFTSYQWYKNGNLVPGATKQYFQDPDGVNGIYSVHLTGYKVDQYGNRIGGLIEFSTCPQAFNPTLTMRVFPIPAKTDEPVYVELDLTPAEMEGAILDIYDAKGAHINHIQIVSSLTEVRGFRSQGTYYGKITTGNNEIKSVKFLIVK